MTIERHDAGPRMSKAVVHGDTVYLAGLTADKTRGKSVGEQTREILALIDGYLAKCGSDKSKLLRTNIWLTDMATAEARRACPGVRHRRGLHRRRQGRPGARRQHLFRQWPAGHAA